MVPTVNEHENICTVGLNLPTGYDASHLTFLSFEGKTFSFNMCTLKYVGIKSSIFENRFYWNPPLDYDVCMCLCVMGT